MCCVIMMVNLFLPVIVSKIFQMEVKIVCIFCYTVKELGLTRFVFFQTDKIHKLSDRR